VSSRASASEDEKDLSRASGALSQATEDSIRQYSIGVVWGSFLKRCPFLALSVQQAAANGSNGQRVEHSMFARRR
jgi:hypothetical protein